MNDLNKDSNTEIKGGIIGWFTGNSVAANLLLFSVIVLGLFSVGDLRKESMPNMSPNMVTVSMTYNSGDARQAEEGIALKIEDALESVSGIKHITSTSNANGSSVRVEMKNGYDLDALLTDVKTKIDSVYNFPVDAEKAVIDKARFRDRALWVQLHGTSDRATLQSLADRLKVDLLAKPGIRDIDIVGKARPMMSIEIDEGQLQAYNLTMTDIANIIKSESSTAITTSLRNGEKVLRLKASEQAYYAQDFAKITLIHATGGAVVTLGDVAKITDTFEDDPSILSRYNGDNAIGLQIMMGKNSDVADIVDQATEVVEEWHDKGLLPENVKLLTWYDQSTLIMDRLALLGGNAAYGVLLVFIMLALFLNMRVAFWVAAGLPFIYCGTLFFMGETFVGLTINEMTTFGFIMALGIVVDDAVVVGESVYTTRQSDGDSLNSTVKGVLKVATPTFFGVLTTVAAFLSLSFISGGMGQIFSQFSSIVAICLLLSIVESKLILPAHLAHLNTQKKKSASERNIIEKIQHGADSSLQWFNQNIYRKAIGWALSLRYAVVLAFFALFILVVGMPMNGTVRISFFPDLLGDGVTGNISMQTDASFGQTQKNLLNLEQSALEADKQLLEKYTPANSEPMETGISSLQALSDADKSGRIIVEFNEDSPYGIKEFERTWRELSGSPEGIQKLDISSSFNRGENFRVELKAWDEATLIDVGKKIKSVLRNTAGVSGIDDNLAPGQAQLKFELNQKGRSLGLTTSDLSRQLLQIFGGEIVQSYQRNKDEIRVRVRYPEEQRKNYSDVLNANVRLNNGTVVTLSSVTNIISEAQQDEITRIDGLRAVFISASVDKELISSNELVNLLKDNHLPDIIKKHPELVIHFSGEADLQAETQSSFISMFVMALLAIYALLAIPLRSYIQPLLIMAAIPFGIVGAIFGHWYNDLTISLLSLFGILALSGVVVNDSLLLVSRFNELVAQGVKVQTAIIESCTSRLRAVLLTSVTTFAGLMPLLSETSHQRNNSGK